MIFRLIFIFSFLLTGCFFSKEPTFKSLDSAYTGITFINYNRDTDTLNILDYLYFYNGAGIASADFNNDGLLDLYFVSNSSSNELYLNQGSLRFNNITSTSRTMGNGSWNTGVTVVDINQDGWQDIYLCTVDGYKNFTGRNQLFINQQDGTFKEDADAYGLAIKALSTHATFFDYDKDGDLDLLLLNHSVHSSASFGDTSLRKIFSKTSGPHLYQNDNQYFTDVSRQVGFLPSALGYGLGISIGDVNNDTWEDIYISNDFHEDDYLFINQKNGTFIDQGDEYFGHFSNFSMGNAMSDINNDGYVDVVSTDMLPLKREILFATENELPNDIYDRKRRYGYHYQYARNALQLNHKGNFFSDIALFAGVAATDWTWSVIAEDFDHDGRQELFFSNGIKRRMNDLDYIQYLEQSKRKRNTSDNDIIAQMPNGELRNLMFKRNGDELIFSNVSEQWGWGNPSASSGSVAVDLDNDGDLDIVTNDMNKSVTVFENQTNSLSPNLSYIKIQSKGNQGNLNGLGLRVFLKCQGKVFSASQYNYAGFMSGKMDALHIGLGMHKLIDSMLIIWPTHKVQLLRDISVNQTLNLSIADAREQTSDLIQSQIEQFIQTAEQKKDKLQTVFVKGLNWKHQENTYYDNNVNRLIPHFYSKEGPAVAVGDLNNDGMDDIYLGGATLQDKQIAVQQKNNTFTLYSPFGKEERYAEHIAAEIVDINRDGKRDILIAAAGGEEALISTAGIYLYQQKEPLIFDKIPILTGSMVQAMEVVDLNGDGLLDIVVAAFTDIHRYAKGSRLSVFINHNGKYLDKTSQWISKPLWGGIITDLASADINSDSLLDIIVSGEWMPIVALHNQGSKFSLPISIGNKGMWQSVSVVDVNQDGKLDIVAGNWGENTKLTASTQFPLKLYYGDFDNNEQEDLILAQAYKGKYYPFMPKNQLEVQLPFLKKEFRSYQKAAQYTIEELFVGRLLDDQYKQVETLSSAVYIQQSNKFEFVRLPSAAQLSPIRSIFTDVYNHSNTVILGANFFGVSIQEGHYDGGLVGLLSWDKKIDIPRIATQETLFAKHRYAVASFSVIHINSQRLILIANNNGELQFCKLSD